jgi:hypothetical protein
VSDMNQTGTSMKQQMSDGSVTSVAMNLLAAATATFDSDCD